jgi:hypothetical protein
MPEPRSRVTSSREPCSICFYWRSFVAAMTRVDPSWTNKPVSPHSCPDKAEHN